MGQSDRYGITEDQLNIPKFGKLQTRSKLLNSESETRLGLLNGTGRTGLGFLHSVNKVQFCGDGILAGVVKICWMKSCWMGSVEAEADKEGSDEKNAKEKRGVVKEREREREKW